MSAPDFMTRAERVERLILDARARYEADRESLPDHWIDIVQKVGVGSQCSELRVDESCREELEDTVKDDVALGIKIGCLLKVGETVFVASAEDSDNRDLHFFFIARSEDELFERVLKALEAR